MKDRPVVAVVDDDLRVLESIENLLQSAGHDVRVYTSGEALLRDPGLTGVNCLVSDISMPGMDGFELQHRMRAVCPGLPVIFLSGHDLSAPLLARALDAHGFLRKPFDGVELLSSVAHALVAGSRR